MKVSINRKLAERMLANQKAYLDNMTEEEKENSSVGGVFEMISWLAPPPPNSDKYSLFEMSKTEDGKFILTPVKEPA